MSFQVKSLQASSKPPSPTHKGESFQDRRITGFIQALPIRPAPRATVPIYKFTSLLEFKMESGQPQVSIVPTAPYHAPNLCELEASMVYRVSFRTSRATQRNPVLKRQTNKKYGDEKKYFLSHFAKTGTTHLYIYSAEFLEAT